MLPAGTPGGPRPGSILGDRAGQPEEQPWPGYPGAGGRSREILPCAGGFLYPSHRRAVGGGPGPSRSRRADASGAGRTCGCGGLARIGARLHRQEPARSRHSRVRESLRARRAVGWTQSDRDKSQTANGKCPHPEVPPQKNWRTSTSSCGGRQGGGAVFIRAPAAPPGSLTAAVRGEDQFCGARYFASSTGISSGGPPAYILAVSKKPATVRWN